MTYFDEPSLAIHWDDDTKIIWAEWRETPPSEVYRRALSAGLELIQQKKARRWLADVQNVGVLPPHDVKWANEDWTPRALAAGLRWMAFVRPKHAIVKMVVKSYVTKIDERDLTMAHFETLDEARAWLRAQT